MQWIFVANPFPRQEVGARSCSQRVLALDGHPSGGAGSDSDDWLKDSRSTSQISGWRLSLRACWGADGLEAITGALSAFSGFCSNSTERGAAYGLNYSEARGATAGAPWCPRGWASAGAPGRVRSSRVFRSPKKPPRSSPPYQRAARCPPPNGPAHRESPRWGQRRQPLERSTQTPKVPPCRAVRERPKCCVR